MAIFEADHSSSPLLKIEVNEALRADPSLANSDPLGAGWFFKVKISDTAQLAPLMNADAYDELLKSL